MRRRSADDYREWLLVDKVDKMQSQTTGGAAVKAWLRLTVMAGVVAVLLLAWPHVADACSCVSFPDRTAEQIRNSIETELDGSAAVFSGEVVSVGPVAVIRVEKVWKGEIGAEVRIRQYVLSPEGYITHNSCDYAFTRGKKYLVFGNRISDDVMSARYCGWTQSVELAAETMKILDRVVSIRKGNEPDAYARFLALEQSWMKARAARDMPLLEALLAPDFTSVGADTVSTVGDRSQWLANAADYTWPQHEVTLLKLQEKDDLTVVHCVLRAIYPPRMITRSGGELEFLVTDVWIKRGAGWQVLSRHATVVDK